MADHEKPVPPVEIAGGLARPLLDPEDMLAFQDWQRLTKEEKAALIWMAKHHPSFIRLAKFEIWMGQTASFLLRLGMGATAIMAVLALLRHLWRGWE